MHRNGEQYGRRSCVQLGDVGPNRTCLANITT
jgi:hypothetical protein